MHLQVIITTRSTAKAIMRVIVWLTKRPGQNDNYYLISARALSRSLYETISHATDSPSDTTTVELCETHSGQLVKRAIQQTRRAHRRGGRKEGGDAARNSHRHYYIATRASLVNGRRAAASCRSADRAKRVSNDRSFSLSPPPPTLFFRDGGIYRATLYARASRALGTSLARSSLIMNGLFIAAAAAHVRHFLRFHCVSRLCARRVTFLQRGKRTLCGLVLPTIMVRGE